MTSFSVFLLNHTKARLPVPFVRTLLMTSHMNLKALSLCLGGNNESTQQQLFSRQISSIFTVLQFKVSHLFLNFCFTASNNVCVCTRMNVFMCVHMC